MWEVTRNVVELAVSLRAKYNLRMLDALHVASAVANGASHFLTNDDGLRRVAEVSVVVISDLVKPTTP